MTTTRPTTPLTMPPTGAADRCLPLTWPHARRLPATAGLVAAVTAGTDLAWADEILNESAGGAVVWAATRRQPERYGMATLERPGVHAVSLAPAEADPRRVHVALGLARRLAAIRAGSLRPNRGYLTSPTRPGTPDGLVRVPHLVSVSSGDAVSDAVVWELTSRAAAEEWLGSPLPDPVPIEAGLPRLVALRGAARVGTVPATPAGRRLAGLLHGRPLPLSIQLVLRHPDLFIDLLTDPDGDLGCDPGEPA